MANVRPHALQSPRVMESTDQFELVNEGALYYKSTKIYVQIIKEYWCELHRETGDHPRQLVLHELQTKSSEKVEVIPLVNVLKISMNKGLRKDKFGFEIMTPKRKHLFGTNTSEEMDSWIKIINEELLGPPKCDVVYDYRVKVERNCDGHTPYGDYILKINNEKIRIFTSNGKLPTKFSCPIKDIYRAKYKTTLTMQSCVVISINNILSNYKVKDILIVTTSSAAEIVKVITHRQQLLNPKDDSSLKSTTSLPVGVPTPTSDDNKSHGNVVSGLVENFQASIEVTVGISETLSRSDTPKCPMLKRKKQVSRSQISSSDHQLEANNTADLEITSSVKDDDDDDAFDTSFDHDKLKSPKRRLAYKRKIQSASSLNFTISERPPMPTPYCTTHPISASTGSLPPTALTHDKMYASIRHHIRPRSAIVEMSKGNRDGYCADDGSYVIDKLEKAPAPYTYLLSSDDEGIYAFLPTRNGGQ
ncbi:uncharacterized protein [Dysidea avara]|uniref:uncharacterized protein n=1 Tax=Dysidea avara TaxID=196820 RepID=UPI00332BE8FC